MIHVCTFVARAQRGVRKLVLSSQSTFVDVPVYSVHILCTCEVLVTKHSRDLTLQFTVCISSGLR